MLFAYYDGKVFLQLAISPAAPRGLTICHTSCFWEKKKKEKKTIVHTYSFL